MRRSDAAASTFALIVVPSYFLTCGHGRRCPVELVAQIGQGLRAERVADLVVGALPQREESLDGLLAYIICIYIL